MPSIHRRPRSPYWYAAYVDGDGRRTLRSTGTTDRTKALKICLSLSDAAREGREGLLTERRVRQAMADLFARANRERMSAGTAREFLTGWLASKALELSPSSLPSYEQGVNTFLASLGAKADRPLDALSRSDVLAYRATLADRLAPATVNKTLRLLRGAWSSAIEASLTLDNLFPASIEVKESSRSTRRPFTLPELRRVLAACDDEWRGMVLLGLYTGQRLGDVAALTWGCVDLDQRLLAFITQKTGRRMELPLAGPLYDYLLTRPSADTPEAPVLPTIHASLVSGGTGTLSRQFSEILVRAGLVVKKPHRKAGMGRQGARESRGLSYHCLRHTATSLLKNAGVSDVIAREIIGHESEAVSRVYTHIEGSTLRRAVEAMPDVTK